MSWPLSQDYNEAIQDPGNSFSDAELKTGEVVANALGIPMPRSGNFADVYEVRCPNGSRWAVKCFTREVYGLRERYSEIGKYLQQANLPFMVDFQYLEQGDRIRGHWYPILKMQWVQGFVLNEFVRDNLDKKPILNALGQIWLRMARRLREAKLAHCDLQHGNVLFVPGSTANSLAVKLIDYDGMCVPALVGTKSGEVGHPAFQHPERLRTGAYNQEVDRFSLLSIAAGLRCLTVGGRELWDKYDNGDNLLFRQSDLQKPTESPLFQELLAMRDPQTQALVKELYNACQGALDKVPLVTDLLPEEKPAGKAAATTVARPTAAVQGPNWDFGDEEASGSVVKKRQKAGKMPGWVWGAIAGAAALLLVGVGVGVGLGLRKGSDEKAVVPVAQIKPEATVPKSKPKTPPNENPQTPNPAASPVNPVNPPSNPSLVSLQPGQVMALSPSGDVMAIAKKGDKTWRLMNPRTLELIREFVGHEEPIGALALSFDGSRAVTLGAEKMLRVWDLQTGQMISSRKVDGGAVVGMAPSVDGKYVVTADLSREVILWNCETWEKLPYVNPRRMACNVACSPDCRFFVSGYDKGDKEQDEVLYLTSLGSDVKDRAFFGHGPPARVTALAISRDGKYVASGQSGATCLVSIWETATGKLVKQMTMDASTSSTIHQVAFSPDGQMVLAASNNFVGAWRIEDGKLVSGFARLAPALVLGAFSADNKQLKCVSVLGNKLQMQWSNIREDGVVIVNPSPPTPKESVAWNPPVDPDGDCKFHNADGKLTITIPAKRHVLEVVSGRANSPRRLLDIDGDFSIQVRVGGDFAPVEVSSSGERFSWIGAGLILWVDGNTFLRLERAGWYGRKPSTLYASWEVRENGKMIETKHNFASLSAAETYLRLERRGKQILASYSEDGQNWIKVNPLDIEIPAKVKIGFLAGSITGRTFAPTFYRFQLKNGRGEMMGVNLPMSPAAETIVVKPPLPSEPVPTPMRPKLRRQPVPAPAAVEAALKDIRAGHKEEYGNGNRIQLQSVLFKDLNGARNDPPRHFALLREIRNVCAETNVRSGLGQAQSMAQYFDVNILEMQCEALERSLRTVHPSAADLVVVGLPLMDRAIGEENYDVLGRLLKIIEPAAAQLPANDGQRLAATSVVAQAKQVKKDYTALQAERKTLENNPDDAKANLALGKFHCALRGDWGDGLPLLARGSDAALKALAEKDLANPDDAAAQIALANAWRKQAGVVNSKSLQLACYKRAYSWYQQAAVQSKGDKLKEVQKALAALAKIPALQNPWWQFGIYSGIKRDATPDYLGIRPGNNMTVRECYRGPIDITVVARSMTTDLNVGIGAGGRLIVGQDFFTKRDRIQVFRPDAVPALMGSRAIEKDVALPANRSFTVRWQVTPIGMKVWFEGELVFEETRSYDLSEKYEVMIHGNSQPIEIKTVTVRRGPQK